MTRAPAGDLMAHCRRVAADVEHALNLRGKAMVACSRCTGKGHTAPGYTDYDGHGSFYVYPEYCQSCDGAGRVEVSCSPELELEAVQREIDKLRARMRKLKRRTRKVSAAGADAKGE